MGVDRTHTADRPPGGTTIRLLVADDDARVRLALVDLLTAQEGVEVVAVAGDAAEAITMAEAEMPDVALLDVRMPGGGGVAAARGISATSPRTRVLAFSAFGDRDSVAAMVEAGASGYLVKSSTPDQLIAGIRQAASGQTALSPEVAGHVVVELSSRLARERMRSSRLADSEAMVRAALSGDVLTMVYQPILDLATETVVGYESLARFQVTPPRSPDLWFADADLCGLGGELELKAVRAALTGSAGLDDAYVAINLSPATLLSAQFMDELTRARGHDVLVEVTEHAPIDDYAEIRRVLDKMRSLGVRLAVDDVGSGFASLRHIVELEPDVIKADISLVAGVEGSPKLRAVIAALVTLGREIGAKLVAEGIETPSQMAVLAGLGVDLGQGYLLGRPGPLPPRLSQVLGSAA